VNLHDTDLCGSTTHLHISDLELIVNLTGHWSSRCRRGRSSATPA
jgi:hypothetical protein